MTNLGCGLYTGAAYSPISKTFSLIFGGCGLFIGNYGSRLYITLSGSGLYNGAGYTLISKHLQFQTV